jgi:outer membrane lipoprotein SlyB
MNRSAKIFAAAALAVSVTACTHPTNSTYDADEVGRVIDTSHGVVLSSRVVDISGKGEESGYGALLGGASGASAGFTLAGRSNAYQVIGSVLGGIIGAGLGWAAEESVDSRQGIEYVLRLDSGKEVTLIQNRASDEKPLPVGTSVLIQRGSTYNRVIPSPVAAQ